jgi:hypothetical protein
VKKRSLLLAACLFLLGTAGPATAATEIELAQGNKPKTVKDRAKAALCWVRKHPGTTAGGIILFWVAADPSLRKPIWNACPGAKRLGEFFFNRDSRADTMNALCYNVSNLFSWPSSPPASPEHSPVLSPLAAAGDAAAAHEFPAQGGFMLNHTPPPAPASYGAYGTPRMLPTPDHSPSAAVSPVQRGRRATARRALIARSSSFSPSPGRGSRSFPSSAVAGASLPSTSPESRVAAAQGTALAMMQSPLPSMAPLTPTSAHGSGPRLSESIVGADAPPARTLADTPEFTPPTNRASAASPTEAAAARRGAALLDAAVVRQQQAKMIILNPN